MKRKVSAPAKQAGAKHASLNPTVSEEQSLKKTKVSATSEDRTVEDVKSTSAKAVSEGSGVAKATVGLSALLGDYASGDSDSD